MGKEKNGFKHKHKRQIKKLRKVKFNILIWGPGINGDHYAKRLKMKEELRKMFPKSEIFFSEDRELNEKFENVDESYRFYPLHLQEDFQLRACDICFVLDNSKGAGEELAMALGNPNNRSKIFVLTHTAKRDNNSFSSAVREQFIQEFYSDKEYEECNLIERAKGHVFSRALKQELF